VVRTGCGGAAGDVSIRRTPRTHQHREWNSTWERILANLMGRIWATEADSLSMQRTEDFPGSARPAPWTTASA
jgi:hypothetical protein